MSITLIGSLIGGLGLFLLGMELLTEGLKRAAGPSLKTILRRATDSRMRGLLTGSAITALVQSSSAVTVATLGFVNAGLMSLGQSIAVIYGSNIGTTLTGWLVALIGFKLKIGALMLPFIGIGMALKFLGGNRRIAHYGLAIAGFGLFFVGLDFIKQAFDGLSAGFTLTHLGTGALALVLYMLAGVIMTTLTQASAAVMAIALSLVHAETINLSAAAAVVIGANIGTTTTALFASIGATANAKRISLAHVIFNIQTGIIGILVLIPFSSLVDRMDLNWFDPVLILAAFHTLFNAAGVLLIWPMTDRLERFLTGRFRTREELASRPQYIDRNLLASPAIAVDAINHELVRVNQLSLALARAALSSEDPDPDALKSERASVSNLVTEIISFEQSLALQDIPREIAETLPVSIRVARYLDEIAQIAAALPGYQLVLDQISNETVQRAINDYKQEVLELLQRCEISEGQDIQGIDAHREMRKLKHEYQALKLELLNQTVSGSIATEESSEVLDYISDINRLSEQAENVSAHWSSTLPIQKREPIVER